MSNVFPAGLIARSLHTLLSACDKLLSMPVPSTCCICNELTWPTASSEKKKPLVEDLPIHGANVDFEIQEAQRQLEMIFFNLTDRAWFISENRCECLMYYQESMSVRWSFYYHFTGQLLRLSDLDFPADKSLLYPK